MTLPVLFPLLFLTLSVHHICRHALIPRSTTTSPVKSSSFNRELETSSSQQTCVTFFYLHRIGFYCPLEIEIPLAHTSSFSGSGNPKPITSISTFLGKASMLTTNSTSGLQALCVLSLFLAALIHTGTRLCLQFLQKCLSLKAFVLLATYWMYGYHSDELYCTILKIEWQYCNIYSYS